MSRQNAFLATNIETAKQTYPWWGPVFRAVQQGITFSRATSGMSALGEPGDPDKGEVLHVGDDNIKTVGPSGVPSITRKLIEDRIETADHIILIACAPFTRFYQEAADAALAGKNVVLIEARQETQTEWVEFIRAHARHGVIETYGLVNPNDGEAQTPVAPGKEWTDPVTPAFLAFGRGIHVTAPAVVDTTEGERARREKFLDDLHEQLEAVPTERTDPAVFWISTPEPERRSVEIRITCRRHRKRMLPNRAARRRKLGFELAAPLTAIGL